jgi:Protein of unknown function (DUF2281)
MGTAQLIKEIETLPLELRKEVEDFVSFLKIKYFKSNQISKREYGFAKGKVKMSDDFDAPLDDFKEYM